MSPPLQLSSTPYPPQRPHPFPSLPITFSFRSLTASHSREYNSRVGLASQFQSVAAGTSEHSFPRSPISTQFIHGPPNRRASSPLALTIHLPPIQHASPARC